MFRLYNDPLPATTLTTTKHYPLVWTRAFLFLHILKKSEVCLEIVFLRTLVDVGEVSLFGFDTFISRYENRSAVTPEDKW